MEYRKELKYLVKSNDFDIIKSRINNVMFLDKNSNNGFYTIRSIYFDDYYNTFYNDNDIGINDRYKIRIRIYNGDDKIIKLEIKYKKDGLTKKESTLISKDLCLRIMGGEQLDISDCNDKVLYKLYLEQKMYLLVPKIIVEYDREAYVNPIGNVRVTFDKNIRVSKHIERFFEENLYSVPILELNKHVLEVKYDELIPDYISSLLELNTLSQTSFSKYYLSRISMKEEVLWVLRI